MGFPDQLAALSHTIDSDDLLKKTLKWHEPWH
jgi:hypothetical protein